MEFVVLPVFYALLGEWYFFLLSSPLVFIYMEECVFFSSSSIAEIEVVVQSVPKATLDFIFYTLHKFNSLQTIWPSAIFENSIPIIILRILFLKFQFEFISLMQIINTTRWLNF
jgi:hypothetical protein